MLRQSCGGPIEGDTVIAGNTVTGGNVIYNLHPGQRENERCLVDLLGARSQGTDPRLDKKNIEQIKGGLLRDSYRWILDNDEFQQWRNDPDSQLLWIRGDPGKGKTMLLCGIIDELGSTTTDYGHLAYFFCEATDFRTNKATAVLRGLIYMLVRKQTALLSYVREWYDDAGMELFEGRNAWVALSEILKNILHDSGLLATLVIDALDECETDRPKLLNFIVQNSSVSSRVKWIVSSRNWPDIEEQLQRTKLSVGLSLELNADSVSAAVKTYIGQKTRQLAELKKYDNKTEDAVRDHLLCNAQDTFLWVALVCERLKVIARRKTLVELNAFPPGLDELYNRMMAQVYEMEDEDDVHLCKQIFAVVAMVYRPITLEELASFIEPPNNDAKTLQEIIGICGSFFTIRQGTIYFIHQSAKDFLLGKQFDSIFPSGFGKAHHLLFSKSLEAMSKTLRRNVYGLENPGVLVDDIKSPNPDPLATVRYSCVYWVGHLLSAPNQVSDCNDIFSSEAHIVVFFKVHLLHWIESLSLIGEFSKSGSSIGQLLRATQYSTSSELFKLLKDAERFVSSYGSIVERAPLQIYGATLAFCPTENKIKTLHWGERLRYINRVDGVRADSDHCLQTTDGHVGSINAIALSPDNRLLASSDESGSTIKLWDTATGTLHRILEGYMGLVSAVVFSPDCKVIASSYSHHYDGCSCIFEGMIKIWDVSTGLLQKSIVCQLGSVYAVAFSPDSKLVASCDGCPICPEHGYTYSRNGTARLWDVATGVLQKTIQGHLGPVNSVAFSPDGKNLASGDSGPFFGVYGGTVKLWDVTSGALQWTSKSHNREVKLVMFSPNGKLIASNDHEGSGKIKLWDVATGTLQMSLRMFRDWISRYPVNSMAFSSDSKLLAMAGEQTEIWDVVAGTLQQTHNHSTHAVTFSSDGRLLVSGGTREFRHGGAIIKLWNGVIEPPQESSIMNLSPVKAVTFSPDGKLLASTHDIFDHGRSCHLIRLWDVPNRALLHDFIDERDSDAVVTFSQDSKIVTTGSWVRDTATGVLRWTISNSLGKVGAVAFSPDGTILISSHLEKSETLSGCVCFWDVATGVVQEIFKHGLRPIFATPPSPDCKLMMLNHWEGIHLWNINRRASERILEGSNGVTTVAFSPDCKLMAFHWEGIHLWNLNKRASERILEDSDGFKTMAFSPDGRLIAAVEYDKVRLWDTTTGAPRETIHVGVCISKIQFLKDAPYLTTNRGLLRVRCMSMNSSFKGQPIFVKRHWVVRGKKNILWLPLDYRESPLALQGNFLAIGHETGQITFVEFK